MLGVAEQVGQRTLVEAGALRARVRPVLRREQPLQGLQARQRPPRPLGIAGAAARFIRDSLAKGGQLSVEAPPIHDGPFDVPGANSFAAG